MLRIYFTRPTYIYIYTERDTFASLTVRYRVVWTLRLPTVFRTVSRLPLRSIRKRTWDQCDLVNIGRRWRGRYGRLDLSVVTGDTNRARARPSNYFVKTLSTWVTIEYTDIYIYTTYYIVTEYTFNRHVATIRPIPVTIYVPYRALLPSRNSRV